MGENQIKKMITTGMLRRLVWMTNDDKFGDILENSQRVIKLNVQYENHLYVLKNLQKSVVPCLYMEDKCKIFFGRDMEFIAGPLPNKASNFFRQNYKLYEGMELHTKKKSGLPLNVEIIKQIHKIMMDKEKHRDGKDVLRGVI